ncbi:MAG TPA: L-histidine N(alpha)-methyltransferase [Bacteroidetes bacterium]|nr:L-histidine N(alpha)-methyltransferase [Bacteroidota bacterium]
MTQNSSFTVLTGQHLQSMADPKQAFALDVLVGLSEHPKRLSSRYFYDRRGSELFEKIMELPEYYLTNCEFNILSTKSGEISRLLAEKPFNLIELGSGDGRKTNVLIRHLLDQALQFKYFPIDISQAAMEGLISSLNQHFPQMHANGLVAEYFSGLKWLQNISDRKNLVLLLGSNLGNFNRPQSRGFLRNLWSSLKDGDYVMIGFDLKKSIDLMQAAYNDHQGITSAFNLNLLRRINHELDGNFDLTKFQHYASYDVFSGAMESYLVSLVKQTVLIREIGLEFTFEAWEPVHTEYSYKYLESDIEELAEQTGFEIVKQLYDNKRYFVDSIWQVKKIAT